MAKVEPQELPQTMEDYLLSQLQEPVITKDGSVATAPDGHKLTKQEAIAINLLNQAMKGDIKTETPPFFCLYLRKTYQSLRKCKKMRLKFGYMKKKQYFCTVKSK